jgi:hypothetical protein
MEPRIQYAQTEDGVNIAFWTLGEGWDVELETVPGRRRVYLGSWQ